jgi:hypothetical protein
LKANQGRIRELRLPQKKKQYRKKYKMVGFILKMAEVSALHVNPRVWNGRRIGRRQTLKSLARSVFLFARI